MTDQPINPNGPNVIQLAEQFRAALDKQDLAALNRLINAYKDIYRGLEGSIETLSQAIAEGNYTSSSIIRYNRYRDLMEQVSEQLRDFQGLLANEISTSSKASITAGEAQARALLSATVIGNPSIAVQFQKLPASAIETLLGFLDPQGPLYARIRQLAPNTVDAISQIILEGVAKGAGSRAIAKRMITDKLGMGLTDALRMCRTVQNYSYREANRATYLANSDICDSWQWFTQLDERACMSCVNMHGSIHPNTETLNDHHNGRCTMLPVVDVFGPTIPEEAGAAWFDTQGESQQRYMMGKGKFQAWKEGKIQLSQMTVERKNDVYGMMKGEAALKDLLGGK